MIVHIVFYLLTLGGCDDCPENSECIEGFCVCEFGYYEEEGLCLKGTVKLMYVSL